MYPEEFQYTKDHEWIRLDGDIGTIGITDHAQKELGDIVYVELPTSGDELTAAETFGTVESVKAVSEIFSPVTGKVTAVNSKLQDHPELLNSDPHQGAWLIRVQMSDPKEVENLMSSEEYEAYIREAESN
jgi:glycine cleavage system H protein